MSVIKSANSILVIGILALFLAHCTSVSINGSDSNNTTMPAETTAPVTATPQVSPSASTKPSATQSLTYTEFIQEMGELGRMLAVRERETYAGYCIVEPGKREAVIAFTANAEETGQRYLEGQPYEGLVRVATAEYPLALLEANLRDEINRIINLGFNGVGGGVDECQNRIVISVPSIAEVEAALQTADSPLPDYVEFLEEIIVEE
mgnify:FL=1